MEGQATKLLSPSLSPSHSPPALIRAAASRSLFTRREQGGGGIPNNFEIPGRRVKIENCSAEILCSTFPFILSSQKLKTPLNNRISSPDYSGNL